MRDLYLAIVLVMSTSAAMAATTSQSAFSWDTWTRPIRDRMPPGPMASWTEQQHKDANKALYGCLMLGAMSTDGGKGSVDELKLQGSYMSFTCLYHVTPPDWIGRAKLAATIRQEYSALQRVNPNIPPPQLDQ